MTNLLKTIYLKNDNNLDFSLYCLQIPFFTNISKYGKNRCDYYDSVSEEVRDLFRKLFYLQYSEFDCKIDVFIELVDFLDFIGMDFSEREDLKKWIPYFRRYLFNFRYDKPLMIKTIFMHYQDEFIMEKKENEPVLDFLTLSKKVYENSEELYSLTQGSEKPEDINIFGV